MENDPDDYDCDNEVKVFYVFEFMYTGKEFLKKSFFISAVFNHILLQTCLLNMQTHYVIYCNGSLCRRKVLRH